MEATTKKNVSEKLIEEVKDLQTERHTTKNLEKMQRSRKTAHVHGLEELTL